LLSVGGRFSMQHSASSIENPASRPVTGEREPSCTGNALEPLDRTRRLQYSSAALTHGQGPIIEEAPKWCLRLAL